MSNLKKSMMILSLSVFAMLFLLTHFVSGQTIFYGKLTGTVTDDTGEPLPGVAVDVTSEALITGSRSTVTSVRGTYVFLNLPTGKYVVTATLAGFKTAVFEDITVTAGVSITVDLTMEPGTIEESVTVTAVGPIVDSKSSTVPSTIDSEMLAKMPTSRDAFYELSLSTPGMVSMGKDGTWLPSPNAYGAAGNENVFLLNGVNTTSPRASSHGSLVSVNYNAVEEVRLVALGSKAEYGNFTGVAIDVLTKSGSNTFHGNVAVYSILADAADNQPKPDVEGEEVDLGSWGEERLFIATGDDILRTAKEDWEGNFTLGGPIIKDKIWFYAGFDITRAKVSRPFWPLLEASWGRFGDLKISAEPAANHRAWVAYHYENNDYDGGTWDPRWDGTLTYGEKTQVHSISAQWQWLASSKSIFTAKYLSFFTKTEPYIPDDAPSNPGYINWWKGNVVGVEGHFPYVEAPKASRHTFQADVSHYAEDFLGEHDIKFGVQYTRGRYDWLGGYFAGYANFAYFYRWQYSIDYLDWWYPEDGLLFYNRQIHLNPFLTVRTTDQWGFFFDDQWSPTKRLTINFGIRYDKMTSKYGEGKVYELASTPAAINDPPPVIRNREGTDNVYDFSHFAPRIGITYALTSDMKTIFRASYGRYYLPLSLEYMRRFGPDMDPAGVFMFWHDVPLDLVDLNGNGWFDPDEVTEATRLVHGDTYLDQSKGMPWIPEYEVWDYSWDLKVGDDLKNQHTDQLTLNLERELMTDLSASLTYIYKRTSDLIVNWPINGETGQDWEYERIPFTTEYGEQVELWSIVLRDYNGDGELNSGDVQWIDDRYQGPGNPNFSLVRNLQDIDGHAGRRTYHGLQFVLKKRFSNRWQMLASFLRSWTDGFAARTHRQDFNYEGPMVMDARFIADPNQTVNNMEGPLPFTQKYELKISGSYRIPVVEADIGLRFRYNSGRPIWPLQSVERWPGWSAVRPEGSVIATAGENPIVSIDPKDPWYLPAEYIFDLRLDKAFRLGQYGFLDVGLDVLNVFNENAVTNAGWGTGMEPVLGKASGLTYPARMARLSVRFRF